MTACALSDIAWADHADVKAQECFRRIVHFPFIGLTHPERVFIGATLHARHAGKPDDPAIQKALALITPSIHRRAQILAVPSSLDTVSRAASRLFSIVRA